MVYDIGKNTGQSNSCIKVGLGCEWTDKIEIAVNSNSLELQLQLVTCNCTALV